MTERQKQIYRLGQVYGYICQKRESWGSPAHDQTAVLRPLQGVTIALMAALRAEKLRLDDKYVMPRMAVISPEIGEGTCSLEEQSIFTLGKMQIHRDAKSLIDMTGLTQAQLAEKLGVKPLTIGRWYRGETPISESGRFGLEEIALEKA